MNNILIIFILYLILFQVHGSTNITITVQPAKSLPECYASGTQYDSNTVFVTTYGEQIGKYVTIDCGKTWNELAIKKGDKLFGPYDGANIEVWFSGHVFVFVNNDYYYNASNAEWQLSSIRSICMRGQNGFRIVLDSKRNRYLERSDNCGIEWHNISTLPVMFDKIYNFDIVSTNLIFALVYDKNAQRGADHSLLKSIDRGKSWNIVCIPEKVLDIYATHLFFLNADTGWISSGRDEGLFVTVDCGNTWKNIIVPERFIGDVYFKNNKEGRIIGTLSNSVYETTDGGRHWRKLNKSDILSPSYIIYYESAPLSRWNDFAVLKTLYK